MVPVQDFSKAGDITIELVQITTTQGFYQDITAQVMGIQIFEDLYSPFISGTLEIRDSMDLMSVFPLSGEEFLKLKLSTPNLNVGNIDSKFYIYKMSNKTPVADKSTVYTLHFISEEAIVDINRKISKTFSGKCSDIANQILSDKNLGFQTDKKFYIEETINSTKYISNFWSPIKNLIDVCSTSVNTNGSGSYVFFENRNGFNFVSLESLYKQPVLQEFIYDVYIRDVLPDGTHTARNITEDYKRIREYKIPVAYDYIDRNRSVLFGSKLFTYDPTTKRYNTKIYDLLEEHKTQVHLNDFPIVSNKAPYRYNSFILNMGKYTGNFSGYGDVTNASMIQNRTSLLSAIDSNKIELIVPGRLDYTIGMVVQVKIYKNEPTDKTDSDYVDHMLSGKYIITAINHYINRNLHECTIEVCKESLLLDLDRKK